MHQILRYFLILVIPVVIILSFLNILIYDSDFYAKEFEKLDVYEAYEKEFVEEKKEELWSYLRGDSDLEGEFFSDRDKAHMKDVKNILIKENFICFVLLSLTIALIIIIFITKEDAFRELSIIFMSSSGIVMLISVFSFVFQELFESAFVILHWILFNNDLWLLDSNKDNLVNLFPEMFFRDYIAKVLINSFIFSVCLFLVGIIVFLLLKRNKNS